jgi:hypothetical protein
MGSYFEDDLTPDATQCSGYADSEAHGASGGALRNAGMNSDPTLPAAGTVYDFTSTRTTFFSAPGGDAGMAATRSAQVDSPLQVELAGPVPREVLRLRVVGSKRIEEGKELKVAARLLNTSGSPIKSVELCGEASRRLLKVGACRTIKNLGSGERDKARIKVELRRAGARRDEIKLRLRAAVDGYRPARATITLKPQP